jgi:hypothetical protein
VDRKRQWRNWRNVKHNAGIRTFFYRLRPRKRAKAPEDTPAASA